MERDYVTIKEYAEDEFIEKKSRFIGCIQPVETAQEAESFIASVRKKNPDARHNVYAYVLKDGLTRRCSDDGEPQGTGGVPVLSVINGRGLCDCAVVVTRYFGGTLLGRGGLVRAYSGAAALAADGAGIKELRMFSTCAVSAAYPYYELIKNAVQQFDGVIDSSVFGASVDMRCFVPSESTEDFLLSVRELSCGSAKALAGEPVLKGQEDKNEW